MKKTEVASRINYHVRGINTWICGLDFTDGFNERNIHEMEKMIRQVQHKLNRRKILKPEPVREGFLETEFPIQNGKALSKKNWTKYCIWLGFDDHYVKNKYKVYLKLLGKHKGSRRITRYPVETKFM